MVSVLISGKVSGSYGKKDLLAAVHRAGRCHGLDLAVAVVEPGAHIAAAGPLLVGRLSQRMV